MEFNRDLNLYKFYWYCGRMGDLEGLFFATKKEIDSIVGQHIHFGEVLGKHSEISGTIENKDITIIDINTEAKQALLNACGRTLSGYNPFDYFYCDNCGEYPDDCEC